MAATFEIMTSCRKYVFRQSMRIYLRKSPAKFHPDPIWNDRALGFFEEVDHPNKNKNNKKNKMSSDRRSVTGRKLF